MGANASWIGHDLPPIVRSGVEYFLLSHRGQLYLVPNACPHRGGPLKFRYINEKEQIVCPMHHNAYSIERLIARDTTLRLCVDPS
ncbi:Rieske (2Fe-2S) protein [Rhizobium grahamii]|uniref:Ferredoxin reductase n=1 Tax=Rhizobium grahamii TaxID=1120045 RepID=A0A370KFY1_9HYPH|nr:Rieske 2Fe-2S domain-containing protein [Rhizobium grahamii]RDJ03535.1 ferredoxin reductase [Rhizobium grahamii]